MTTNAIPATSPKYSSASILQFLIAALPLYPAVQINLDAAQGQGSTWAVVGVSFVVFCAVCIENAAHSTRDRQRLGAILWGLLGTGFLALNIMNALGNVAAHSDHSRDHSRAAMVMAADLAAQRSQLSARRLEQAKVAGEATPESIEAEAKALKAREARLWSASYQCDPQWITKDATKTFCAEVATLEAKKAAAVKRDQIDAQLAKLEDKAESKGEAPSSVDSFADAMAAGLAAFGYEVDEKGKLAITRARDWGKAIGVELLAGFGPSGLLLLLGRAGGNASRAETKKVVPRAKAPAAALRADEAAPALHGDPMHSFIMRRLERQEGATVAAGEVWRLWQLDCEERGLEAGTQKAFGQNLKKSFAHEKKNNRPRYLDVRIKREQPAQLPLRLAVVNA